MGLRFRGMGRQTSKLDRIHGDVRTCRLSRSSVDYRSLCTDQLVGFWSLLDHGRQRRNSTVRAFCEQAGDWVLARARPTKAGKIQAQRSAARHPRLLLQHWVRDNCVKLCIPKLLPFIKTIYSSRPTSGWNLQATPLNLACHTHLTTIFLHFWLHKVVFWICKKLHNERSISVTLKKVLGIG